MTFAPHYRLTASGVFVGIGSGAVLERWAFRVNLSRPPTLDNSFSDDRLTDYREDLEAFFTSAGAAQSDRCAMTEVKLASIGADGKYTDDPFIQTSSAVGTLNAGFTHPLQCAIAVSLESDRRGASGRGRFYVPCPALALSSADALITQAAQEAMEASVAALINDLNNIPGIDPVNTPRVTIASSKGYNSDVTSVRVGRAFDTIRSRRTSLPELYGASTVVS